MITIKDLTFGYHKRRPVLQDLTMELEAGGIYGILGANGVGKTTFLHLLSGLLFPQNGQLEVAGHSPARRQPGFLENVFYVPVTFDLPRLRIGAYAGRYAPFYPKFDRTAWKNALELFKLDEKDRIHALSFGQQKKVLLSFALSSGCDLLLFDEPTDGLDIVSKDGFRRLLAQQVHDQRLILVATHHVQDIAMLLDQLVIFREHGVLLHASIVHLSGQFHSVLSSQVPAGNPPIFSERVPGGYHSLIRNSDGQEGPLDLELFYKALQACPELAQQPTSYEKHL